MDRETRPSSGSSIHRRLHVLHVSMPTSEGTAIVALGYIREQVERGWSVTVACPSDGWLGYSARELGARTQWWSATRDPGASVLGEVVALSRIVADCRPDIVHLHSAKAGLAGRLAVRGSRVTFYQPHGWSFLAATGRTRQMALWWEKHATRWTDQLVCVSDHERSVGEAAGIGGSTTVLPNGVDLAARQPQGRKDRAEARRALGLTDSPTAVCIGRLARQKGQEDLLDAWAAVRDRVADARLVLIGDGPDRQLLERRAEELPGVSLVGARSDVDVWLAAANVVVVPSRWEGMALVPLEAMAAARSVVQTDVTGVADSLSGEVGAMVAVGDVDQLAEAVAHRLTYLGEADDEGWLGRSHVERFHDAASSAQALGQDYLRLLAARRRSRA